jgi:RNA polymerase sigma factor (sigma-70 family)
MERTHLVDGEPDVVALVQDAVQGDKNAWEELVRRYTPLLMSILRGYRLTNDDLYDVAQTVWLRLVEHLGRLREPRALPGWLVTTARNESVRVLKANARTRPFSGVFETDPPLQADDTAVDEDLLRAERREATLEAFAELSDRDRELLTLLVADPPLAYTEISQRLNMPIGSIGPTRARILARLRKSSSLTPFVDAPPIITGRN